MEKMYHWTSYGRWAEIVNTGALLPLSIPIEDGRNVSERIREIIGNRKYLVGLTSPESESWKKSELFDYLMGHIYKRVLGARICLEVPILSNESGFVREHALTRDKKYEGDEGWQKYFESTTPLSEYDGNFSVPEIWLSQITPLELIRVVPTEITKKDIGLLKSAGIIPSKKLRLDAI